MAADEAHAATIHHVNALQFGHMALASVTPAWFRGAHCA